jgi:hypothetical protein
MNTPADDLTVQFLAWVADRERSYGEVMEAWQSSCPRLTIWEDVLIGGLVRIENPDRRPRDAARVCLTARGQARLEANAERAPGCVDGDRQQTVLAAAAACG